MKKSKKYSQRLVGIRGNSGNKYTQHLTLLSNLTKEQLLAANDILSSRHQWGHELIKSVSPDLDQNLEKEELKKEVQNLKKKVLSNKGKLGTVDIPKPREKRYSFKRFIGSGGESIILLAFDKLEKQDVIFKFIKPSKIQEVQEVKQVKKPPTKFEKSADYVRNIYKNILEKSEVKKDKDNISEDIKRAKRGFCIQKSIHMQLVKKGLLDKCYIPAIYHISETPELYAIMEYIEGPKLLDWCGSKSEKHILELFFRIIQAVEYVVHRHQIIHSDFKPANILVLKNGIPVLIDFGISKVTNAAKITTARTKQLGTAAYTSKEDINNPEGRTYSTDTFSLSRVLWAMWNKGEIDTSDIVALFESDGTIKYDDEDIRSKYDTNIFPKALKKIFVRGQNIDPCLRYQDISDLCLAIENVLLKEYHDTPQASMNCEDCKGLQMIYKEIQKIKTQLKNYGEFWK